MARKIKAIIAINPRELASVMGLSPADALEWELRDIFTKRIIETMKRNDLTVSEVAKEARTSRARVTKILKGDSTGISLDVLLHLLQAVGQTIKVSFRKDA